MNASALTYNLEYTYNSVKSHQLDQVWDPANGILAKFKYNTTGSVTQIDDPSQAVVQDFFWNEQQQLTGVSNQQGVHHYVYDHSGERVMKSSLINSTVYLNDQVIDSASNLDPYTVYVNPFYVVTGLQGGDRVSKHYYMNQQRVATDISINYDPSSKGGGQQEQAKGSSAKETAWSPALTDFNEVLVGLGQKPLDTASLELPTLAAYFPETATSKSSNSQAENASTTPRILFWYHPDYLGNVDLITERDGYAHEFFMYNPWGEEMHQWNANTYAFTSPYRFNAKELDPETGLAYYGARYYQNKLGVWLSVDRLAEKYPQSSPYVFSGNNPITYVDPNGDSILVNVWNEVSGGFDNFSWQKNASGSWEFQDKDGNAYSGSDKSLRAMESGLNYLISGGTTGNDLVSELANNTSRSVTLLYSNNINRADGSGNFVSWNPNLTSSGPDVNGSNSRPAFIGLGHELAHIKDEWNGTKNIGIWFDNSTLSEIYACHVENKIRAENNIPLRKSYDTGGIYDVIDSQNRSIFFNSSENHHPNFYQIRPKESRYVY